MHPWISYPLTLTGNKAILIALEQAHIPPLVALAQDKRIWQYYSVDGGNAAKLTASLEAAYAERAQGLQAPFAIIDAQTGKLAGSTRLYAMQPEHKKLEIGWTWLHPDHWATGLNLECKYLLLGYCFESLGALRVQLKTDVLNERSKAAIQKIGGRFEGILRNDMLRDNGTRRNSAYYSLIEEEWPEAKANLERLMGRET